MDKPEIMTNLEILEMKHGLNKAIPEQPKSQCKCIDCNLPELESDKPEQPNTELLIVKTIQGLAACINNELDKLSEGISVLEHCTRPKPKLIAKALEEIDLFEKTTLFELQKECE